MPARRAWTLLLLLAAAACEPEAARPVALSDAPLPSGTLPAGESLRGALTNLAGTDLAGITLHHLEESADSELLLVEISPDHFEPVLINAAHQGMTLLETPDQTYASEAFKVIIGSGFVTEVNPLNPLGLLMSQGVITNPVEPHGYTRILGIADRHLDVIHKSEFAESRFHSALQLGPGIVEQGLLDISERDLQRPRYFRAVLAICQDRWVAGVSLVPMNLRTLGQASQAFFKARQWQCDEMVNFAGDRQAAMLIRLSDRVLYHGDLHTRKVSYLGFKRH